MTEAEIKTLHRAIAEEFEPGQIVLWQGELLTNIDGVRIDAPYHCCEGGTSEFPDWPVVAVPDYRHPVHWARLQIILKIEVGIAPWSSSRDEWVARIQIYDNGVHLGQISGKGDTPAEAIIYCVREFLWSKRKTEES